MRTLLCLLFIAATSSAADIGNGKDYFPLKVGTKWTYKVEGKDARFVITAAGEEKVGDVVCVKLEAKLMDQVAATEHVAAQKDGIYRYKFNELPIEPGICFLKYAVKKGDSWKQEFKHGATNPTVRFEVDFADVKVPAGEFKNALVIRAVATEKAAEGDFVINTTIWYVKGKGMVKQSIDFVGTPAKVRLELESMEEPKK
jgi:hypothetical protein